MYTYNQVPRANNVFNSNLRNFYVFLIQLFLFLMLVVPTTFQFERGLLLGLIVAVAGIVAVDRWSISVQILYIWFATMLVGLIGVAIGVANIAPGALRVTSVFLIWPLLYILFIGLVHDVRLLNKIESAIIAGIFVATATSLVVMFSGLLGYSDIIYPLLAAQDPGFGMYDGFIEYRVYSLTTVIYAFGFILAYILVHRHSFVFWQWLFYSTLLFLVFVAAIGSGRRAFWLVILLSPFVVVFFTQLTPYRFKWLNLFGIFIALLLLGMGILAVIVNFLNLDLDALGSEFLSAFSNQEDSTSLRYLQGKELWAAFQNAPLLGNGLGSAVSVLRSEEQPWAYELSYLALLMNVGVVGFLIYIMAVIWIILKGVSIARKNSRFAKLFVPLVSAMCLFLIINATNPYLAKFDYLWVIFIPVALINSHLTRRSLHD